jgi:hypothetical protein
VERGPASRRPCGPGSRPPNDDATQEAELADLLPSDLAGEEQYSGVFVTVLLLYLYKIAYAAQARQSRDQ